MSVKFTKTSVVQADEATNDRSKELKSQRERERFQYWITAWYFLYSTHTVLYLSYFYFIVCSCAQCLHCISALSKCQDIMWFNLVFYIKVEVKVSTVTVQFNFGLRLPIIPVNSFVLSCQLLALCHRKSSVIVRCKLICKAKWLAGRCVCAAWGTAPLLQPNSAEQCRWPSSESPVVLRLHSLSLGLASHDITPVPKTHLISCQLLHSQHNIQKS